MRGCLQRVSLDGRLMQIKSCYSAPGDHQRLPNCRQKVAKLTDILIFRKPLVAPAPVGRSCESRAIGHGGKRQGHLVQNL